MPDRSFRIVCQPELVGAVEAFLEAEGFRFQAEPFSAWGRKLLYEPFPLGSSLAAFFGYVYIQDRSSMLPPLALAPPQGASVLDMAASPGSKSGFLGQLVGQNGFVLANEPNPARLATLRQNLDTLNLLQIATCSYPGEKLPQVLWSHILLDPPCSGWGTAKKHPEAAKIWRGEKIKRLLGLQRLLLAKAAALLRQGGRLLYSTCTTNPAENAEQTKFAIENLAFKPVAIAPFAGFVFDETPYGALLVNGDESRSQGFYLSLLEKTGAAPEHASEPVAFATLLPRDRLAGQVCDPRLAPPGSVAVFGEKVRFLPQAALNLPEELKWQGFALGKISGAFFRPEARLRALLPRPQEFPDAPRIILDNVADLRKLLAGARLEADLKAPFAGLWHRDLPLGVCRIRAGRIIAAFRG